jgi:hypothetical protein
MQIKANGEKAVDAKQFTTLIIIQEGMKLASKKLSIPPSSDLSGEKLITSNYCLLCATQSAACKQKHSRENEWRCCNYHRH